MYKGITMSVKTLFARVFRGSVHFSSDTIKKKYTADDGTMFHIIRDIEIDTGTDRDPSPAVFIVRFNFAGLSRAVNKRLSVIPAPFLVAMSKFRRKIWAVSEEGVFQGLYQWASYESAESYPRSFIFKIMTKRAKTGTVSYEIIPGMQLKEYLETVITKKSIELCN